MDNGYSQMGRTGSKGSMDLIRGSSSGDREKIAAARARQRAIGRELRRMYDDVVQEQVPDEFMDLLRKIDDAPDKGGR